MDDLNKPLSYQRLETPPQELTLEVGEDYVRLIEPPQYVWVNRITFLCWGMFAIVEALMCSWMTIRTRAFMASLGAPSTAYWPFLLNWGICALQVVVLIFLLLDHFRFCRIPLQIEMTPTHLNYSRRGIFGVRFRRYDLSEISAVSVRDLKGLRGKVSRRVLIISLGRWRRIGAAFSGEKMPMAAEAEAAFKRMLPGISH
jgi:hypothetical protein